MYSEEEKRLGRYLFDFVYGEEPNFKQTGYLNMRFEMERDIWIRAAKSLRFVDRCVSCNIGALDGSTVFSETYESDHMA